MFHGLFSSFFGSTDVYSLYRSSYFGYRTSLYLLTWCGLDMVCVCRAEYDLLQIELSKNYGLTEWHDDLKKVMLKAGVENNPVVFLFSDTQVYLLPEGQVYNTLAGLSYGGGYEQKLYVVAPIIHSFQYRTMIYNFIHWQAGVYSTRRSGLQHSGSVVVWRGNSERKL